MAEEYTRHLKPPRNGYLVNIRYSAARTFAILGVVDAKVFADNALGLFFFGFVDVNLFSHGAQKATSGCPNVELLNLEP